MPQPLADLVHPGWLPVLEPHQETFDDLGAFLRAESSAGRGFLPDGNLILRAFTCDPAGVRVLILGQDPYPTPGHAVGLSFSVASDVQPLPRSLVNIFREYQDDLGLPAPSNGDLTPWFADGVLLLNRVLTVQPGKPASHRNHGWEEITGAVVAALAARPQPLVAILWGRDARSAANLLAGQPSIQSPHPSPMSADRGFFGSRPFSKANELLQAAGGEPVNWRLP